MTSSMRKSPSEPVNMPRASATALNGTRPRYRLTSFPRCSVSTSTWKRLEGLEPRKSGCTRLNSPEAVMCNSADAVLMATFSRRRSRFQRPRRVAVTVASPSSSCAFRKDSTGTTICTAFLRSEVLRSSARSKLAPSIKSLTLP